MTEVKDVTVIKKANIYFDDGWQPLNEFNE
jgi:hypothetical protein